MSRNLDPAEPAGFPWRKLLLIVFVAGLCFVLGVGAGIVLLAKFGDFPAIESVAAYRPSVTSKIFDGTTASSASSTSRSGAWSP